MVAGSWTVPTAEQNVVERSPLSPAPILSDSQLAIREVHYLYRIIESLNMYAARGLLGHVVPPPAKHQSAPQIMPTR